MRPTVLRPRITSIRVWEGWEGSNSSNRRHKERQQTCRATHKHVPLNLMHPLNCPPCTHRLARTAATHQRGEAARLGVKVDALWEW